MLSRSFLLGCLAGIMLFIPACELRGSKVVVDGPAISPEVSAALSVAAYAL